jgi:hypothetical protein
LIGYFPKALLAMTYYKEKEEKTVSKDKKALTTAFGIPATCPQKLVHDLCQGGGPWPVWK